MYNNKNKNYVQELLKIHFIIAIQSHYFSTIPAFEGTIYKAVNGNTYSRTVIYCTRAYCKSNLRIMFAFYVMFIYHGCYSE